MGTDISWLRGSKPNYVYVASSWRNVMQPGVVAALRSAGIACYDFKKPEGVSEGFHWTSVMPSYKKVGPGMAEQLADQDEYVAALDHPSAIEGFERDWDAMNRADAFVLILPCGRSAHLELGWAVGRNIPTAILLDGDLNDGKVTPELMYRMVDTVHTNLFDLLGWLNVED